MDALIDPQFRDLNYQVMDGSEVGVDEIINACETLPFMSDRRLIVVKDSVFLTNRRNGSDNQNSVEDGKRLGEYIKDIPPTTYVIFYVRNGIGVKWAI